MATFTLVSKSDPGEVLKASHAYLAAAWGDAARDWTAADMSGSQLFEDVAFRDTVRRLVCRRIRYEVRNNVYLDGMMTKFPEAVGYGTLRSRTSDDAYNREVDEAWAKYAEDCGADGSSLRQMQLMCATELALAGEYFKVELDDGKVQIIPTENCGTPNSGGMDTSGIVNGIKRDTRGKPERYYFGTVDQYGNLTFDEKSKQGVEARYVTHVFKRDRVSMGRGITWLISALPVARLLFQITEGKTKQILDANSISGFITKAGGADLVDEMARQQKAAEDAAILAAGGTPAAAAPTNPTSGNATVKLANGTFLGLEPGESVTSLINTYQAQDYNQLIMLMLHAISSPLGLPVELWFSGLGDVNYSGYKGLGTQWDGRRKSIIQMIEDEDLEPHFLWWVKKQRKAKLLPDNPDGDDMKHAWVWRATAVLDEEKKSKAAAARVESGQTSQAQEWEAEGYFEDEVLSARKNSWEKLCIASGKPVTAPPIEFLLYNRLPGPDTVGVSVAASPDSDAKPAATGAQAEAAVAGDVQSAALNGAQVTALVDLAAKVQTGELPAASAKAIARASFPLVSSATLDGIFDGIKPAPVQPATR